MYPIHQSPLYRIKGIGQFEKALLIKWDSVPKLLKSKNFNAFVNNAGRPIQPPIGHMELLHKRIGLLLSKIEQPKYLHSKKGFSHITNAKVHIGETPLIKTDIHKFYPSTSRLMVYSMFVREFECAKDIAYTLANICCYEQKHLPTGSNVSGYIAFFSAQPIFNEIDSLAKQHGCTFTLYVDDIIISGEKATKKLLSKVRLIILKGGYKTKNQKSMTFSACKPKKITGAIVSANGLAIPNEQRLRIYNKRKGILNALPAEYETLNRSLKGSLLATKQIMDA